jgi:SOS-response transcriptional repressor LexA
MRKKNFARWLRQVLFDRSMKGCELAHHMHIDSDVVSRWRTAKHLPSAKMMDRLASVLGIPTTDIERHITDLAKTAESGFRTQRSVEPGYRKICREDLPARWQGRFVPMIARIAAGPGIDTWEAEAFSPGDANEFVEYPGAPKNAIAVEVVGKSMLPEYEPGDVIIADLNQPVESGVAVVLYLTETGERIARLKRIRHEGKCTILESSDPAVRKTRLRAGRRLKTGRILAHLYRNAKE